MSKKNHPTIGNVRQGQTIYLAWYDFSGLSIVKKVTKRMLYSSKQSLPRRGCIIEKMPVSFLVKLIKMHGNSHLFYSERKAKRWE